MPFGLIVAAGIGAAGSIGSSLISSNAQSQAGKLLYEKGNQVGQSIDKATGGAIAAGYAGLKESNDALDSGLSNTYKEVDQGVTGANNVLGSTYADQMKMLDPYIQGGQQAFTTLSGMLQPGGALMQDFTAADMAKYDPGFGFRLAEGNKALMASAAARGMAQGGGAMKAALRYSQGLASSEFGDAFNRFRTNKLDKYNMLSGLAGFGERATGEAVNATGTYGGRVSGNIMTGGLTKAGATLSTAGAKAADAMQGNQWIGATGLQGAEAAGNAYTGGALGRANGIVGSGNAIAGGINGAANAITGPLMLNWWQQQQQLPLTIDNTPASTGGTFNYGPGGGTFNYGSGPYTAGYDVATGYDQYGNPI